MAWRGRPVQSRAHEQQAAPLPRPRRDILARDAGANRGGTRGGPPAAIGARDGGGGVAREGGRSGAKVGGGNAAGRSKRRAGHRRQNVSDPERLN
jgi:hypothetical protein